MRSQYALCLLPTQPGVRWYSVIGCTGLSDSCQSCLPHSPCAYPHKHPELQVKDQQHKLVVSLLPAAEHQPVACDAAGVDEPLSKEKQEQREGLRLASWPPNSLQLAARG